MKRHERIAMAKEMIRHVESNTEDLAPDSVEFDIGRFTDQKRFEVEKEKIFLSMPQVLALTADVPEPNDYYTTTMAGRPILITRDRDGKVHAFWNACRHRGVQIAEGCGHAKSFTCGYHGWTFANDGRLMGVPIPEAFKKEELAARNLVALPCEELYGLIVVHPQPNGELNAKEFLGRMGEHLSDYGLDNIHFVDSLEQEARINWKHAVDGGVEGYHVPYLHPETVGPMSGRQFMHVDMGLHHILATPETNILSLKDIPEEEWEEWCGHSISNAIFPNTVLVFGKGIIAMQRSDPGNHVGVCNYMFRVYAWGKKGDAANKEMEQGYANFLNKVAIEEDMKIQSNSQVMMEAGIVPDLLFGRKEANLIKMHRNYDLLSGYAKAAE